MCVFVCVCVDVDRLASGSAGRKSFAATPNFAANFAVDFNYNSNFDFGHPSCLGRVTTTTTTTYVNVNRLERERPRKIAGARAYAKVQ